VELEGLKEAMLEELASRVAGVLGPGDIVVLTGEVEGLKDGRRVRVNHMDLYRLEGIEDHDVLELEDYLEPDAVTFIEWADPALGVIENPSIVHIYHETPTTRRISLRGPGADRLTPC
jgi:tRNA threonylcarbamoyladenosine biosynthesis protein TsaE